MTPTEQQIHALLERKQELTQFTPTYRWLVEAVELMLRAQLELREEIRKDWDFCLLSSMTDELRKDLCREITKEVMAALDQKFVGKVKIIDGVNR